MSWRLPLLINAVSIKLLSLQTSPTFSFFKNSLLWNFIIKLIHAIVFLSLSFLQLITSPFIKRPRIPLSGPRQFQMPHMGLMGTLIVIITNDLVLQASECLWGVGEVFVRCLWGVGEVVVRFLWGVCGVFVGCLWGVCEVFVRCLWGVCEVFVRCLWGVCEVFVRLLWGVCDLFERCLWVSLAAIFGMDS